MATANIETLWTDVEATLTIDRAEGVVRFVRTTQSLPELPVLRARMLEMMHILGRVPRARLGLLVDARQAIGRSDDDFEAVMSELRPRLFAEFRRISVLVKSAVGRLQVQRLARTDGIVDRLLVTGDEAEALAWVRGS